jgi:dolichol-phosphate mannosyltransferase
MDTAPTMLQEAHPARAKDALDLTVIVPTYKEAENLPVLVPQIAEALEKAGIRGEVLVVDDDSPDDTEMCCKELALTYPVRLVVRKGERGLSSAVLHGMRLARGAVLVVMDADLSHPPEKVPELFRAVQSGGADFVIGSRYTTGGATEEGWGFYRWLNSKVATWLARPLTPAHDPMAGFFALRKSAFEAADRLDPVGYKIGLELMVKCGCRTVREVPITFRNRLHGASKLSLKEQLNYLRHLRRLYIYRLGHLAQPAQFVLVGATGMVVDLLVFSVLLLMLPGPLARALAIWAAMSWNFGLNRRLTFPSARRRPAWQQYGLFCLSCLLGAAVNWSVYVSLTTGVAFFADWPIPAAVLGILAGTAFNFVMSKHVAFR